MSALRGALSGRGGVSAAVARSGVGEALGVGQRLDEDDAVIAREEVDVPDDEVLEADPGLVLLPDLRGLLEGVALGVVGDHVILGPERLGSSSTWVTL